MRTGQGPVVVVAYRETQNCGAEEPARTMKSARAAAGVAGSGGLAFSLRGSERASGGAKPSYLRGW